MKQLLLLLPFTLYATPKNLCRAIQDLQVAQVKRLVKTTPVTPTVLQVLEQTRRNMTIKIQLETLFPDETWSVPTPQHCALIRAKNQGFKELRRIKAILDRRPLEFVQDVVDIHVPPTSE